MNSLSMF